ncbi:helix-turn-helix domain-containing protein [Peribacillus sp. NPDC097206]|uniref:helix-turn-helix domain-containing protein n=1 Tax=Peribacillus sp. NPDC097206 TaxID=3364398 RepID=UPI00380D1933
MSKKRVTLFTQLLNRKLTEENLTNESLGEKLEVSHSYVSQVKNGTAPSKRFIKVFAEYFNLSSDECMNLANTDADISNEPGVAVDTQKAKLNNLVENSRYLSILSLIEPLNEKYQEEMLEKLAEFTKQELSSHANDYSVKDVKKELLKVFLNWKKQLWNENCLDTYIPLDFHGYLTYPDGKVYFKLVEDINKIHLSLQFKERHYGTELLELIPGFTLTYFTYEDIQPIYSQVRMIHFVRFSPMVSIQDINEYQESLDSEVQEKDSPDDLLQQYIFLDT